MIYCVIGTRAQLIKMAPVIAAIEDRGWSLCLILTGQHMISMEEIRQDFDLKTRWKYLIKKNEAKTVFSSINWLLKILWLVLFNAKKIVPDARKDRDIVLVHGDTFSTVIGALLGKLSGSSVAHVESGLRSFNVWNPFPEELNRLVTFSLSNIAFCPGEWAVDNLESFNKIDVINTHQNTLIDSLALALKHIRVEVDPKFTRSYAVVSIHRFENIYNKKRAQFIIDAVLLAANHFKIVFVMHPVTKKRLEKMGLTEVLSSNKDVQLKPRVGYVKFVALLEKASFVITDGGSNQEELAYLGIPTLLMRKVSERPEGLGENVVLSNYSREVVEKFLFERSPEHKRDETDLSLDISPTEVIVNYLELYSH